MSDNKEYNLFVKGSFVSVSQVECVEFYIPVRYPYAYSYN